MRSTSEPSGRITTRVEFERLIGKLSFIVGRHYREGGTGFLALFGVEPEVGA